MSRLAVRIDSDGMFRLILAVSELQRWDTATASVLRFEALLLNIKGQQSGRIDVLVDVRGECHHAKWRRPGR